MIFCGYSVYDDTNVAIKLMMKEGKNTKRNEKCWYKCAKTWNRKGDNKTSQQLKKHLSGNDANDVAGAVASDKGWLAKS